MNWEDRPQVKKGNVGERIVEERLRARGYIPYRPIADCAHPFDRLCATPDKKRIFIAEIKTKPARRYYPDTGIDLRHRDGYLYQLTKHDIDTFLYFVDEDRREIYGNKLSYLQRTRAIEHEGRELTYPLVSGHIVYFPLAAMARVASLTDEQVAEIRSHSTRSARYVPEESRP